MSLDRSNEQRLKIESVPFAIYVHWPFCVSKCPYCDFNSHVRDQIDQDRWQSALLTELDYWAARTQGARVSAVFFGGGTPSTMPPDTTAAIIDRIRQHWPVDPDVEITLEANPSSSDAARFAAFADAGVNRFSIGVQSFDDKVLRFLGRAHRADEAHRAIEMAQQAVGRVSFDLIYALPDQTAQAWRRQLDQALDYGTDHLSLYQLTIEPNTGFAGQVTRGVFTPLPDDPSADLYDLTQEWLQDAGLPAYETSNHARRGGESRHNLAYWRYGSWIGIGPGAHGRPVLSSGHRLATDTIKKPERWLQAVEKVGCGRTMEADISTPLPAAEQGVEALVMGLRLSDGISRPHFRAMTGVELDSVIDPSAVTRMMEAGLLRDDSGHLAATPDGRLVLNALLAEIAVSSPAD